MWKTWGVASRQVRRDANSNVGIRKLHPHLIPNICKGDLQTITYLSVLFCAQFIPCALAELCLQFVLPGSSIAHLETLCHHFDWCFTLTIKQLYNNNKNHIRITTKRIQKECSYREWVYWESCNSPNGRNNIRSFGCTNLSVPIRRVSVERYSHLWNAVPDVHALFPDLFPYKQY